MYEDFVANPETFHSLAYLLDYTGRVAAGNVWHGELDPWQPLPRPKVIAVHAKSANFKEHIFWSNRRFRDLLVLQDICSTVFVKNYCLHTVVSPVV